jgi:starch phosphorylase
MLNTDLITAPPRARETTAFRDLVLAKLTYAVGKDRSSAQLRDWFMATAYALRDHVIDQWMTTTRRAYAERTKRVYFLSVEFLIGRLLFDTMCNLAVVAPVREALADLGVDLNDIRALEPDAALGNGGLGRLAACFMDSLATLGIPAYGYGIR